MNWLAVLLRQPMMHFLLGGGLLFLAYAMVGPDVEEGATAPAQRLERRIVVTKGQVESLAEAFASRWRRTPNENELAELVAEHVREEALVREALALGLDQGDSVIRRQLRLKMEYLAQDTTDLEPTGDELQMLLTSEAARFSLPAQVSFRHVFVDAGRRGEAAARAEAGRLLASLQGPDGDAVADEAGDRFLPGYSFRQVSAPEIGRTFGGNVAAVVEAAPVGAWTGPVLSAYGLHLLRVEARTAARLPALGEVRPPLRAEWAARRRREALGAFVAALVARYAVTVEGLE